MTRAPKLRSARDLSILAFLLLMTGWSIACGGPVDESNNSGDCADICAAGTICQNGACVPAGGNMTSPPANMTTPAGNTSANNAASGAAVGASCATRAECATDLCLNDEDIPGGYCSKVCATGLPGADDRCPTGSTCIPLEGGTSICLQTCASQGDCRDGYACDLAGSQQVCLPACQSDEDCPLDSVCNLTSGVCTEAAAGAGRIGGSCSMDGDCSSGVCFDESQTDWPGGSCVGGCDQVSGEFCDGSNPSSGLCLELEDGNICLPSCRSGVDCRDGYACSADIAATNEQGYGFCIPSCEYFGCDPGQYCDVTGFCEDEVAEANTYVETTSLGVYELDSQSYYTLDFDVPSDASSFTITLDSDGDLGAIDGLRGPNGEVLHDYADPLSSKMKYFDGDDNPFSLIYPNAPSLNLPTGTYEVDVAAYGPGNVEVILHIKRGDPPRAGALPLTLWFTSNAYFNAASAQNDPEFQAAVARMQQIYLAANIDLSPIVYRDVAEPAASLYSVADLGTATVGEIVYESFGGSRPEGANIVFVEQFLTEDGDGLYGVSAGLPGPPSSNGSNTLGVLVGLDIHFYEEGGLDTIELGATMAHELGHYLGLFHISESDGASHDPLSDTPECYIRSDADDSGSLSADECGEPSARNVMFWTSAYGYDQDQLSTAQEWVLQRNPAILP